MPPCLHRVICHPLLPFFFYQKIMLTLWYNKENITTYIKLIGDGVLLIQGKFLVPHLKPQFFPQLAHVVSCGWWRGVPTLTHHHPFTNHSCEQSCSFGCGTRISLIQGNQKHIACPRGHSQLSKCVVCHQPRVPIKWQSLYLPKNTLQQYPTTIKLSTQQNS